MLDFARRQPEEREPFIRDTANRRGVTRLIAEKDYWICVTLRLLFDEPELRRHLVFKGGTSLFKVFGIINRFSEDIDLSVDPAWLGFSGENSPERNDISRSERERRCGRLEHACAEATRD